MLRVPTRVSGMNLYGGSVQSDEMIIVILLDSLLGTVGPKSVSETMYLVVAQLKLDPAGKELPRGDRRLKVPQLPTMRVPLHRPC
jgi:hypothetical protein